MHLLPLPPGQYQLRFGSRFDVSEAEHLRDEVRALHPFAGLALDFSGVREFQDCAIAILASTLRGLPREEVEVRGLTAHQWRLLKYFGIEPPTAAI
jgi:hypothetical protein